MPDETQGETYSLSIHETTIINDRLLDTTAELEREMMLYEAALELIQAKLRTLIAEFRLGEDRSPIDNIQTRIKSPQSILEKMHRKGYPLTLQSLRENVLDIAGARVVCPFMSDIYSVAEMLLRQEDVTLLQVKDYIKNPKPSGYRSLHLIVAVKVYLSDANHLVPVELQLRTIAMNCWARAEHQVRYKKTAEIPAGVEEELRECAELMCLMDEKAQHIADQMNRNYRNP